MNKNRIIELQNLEADVDPKVWKSIEAVLDQRRKRRIFFLLLLSGIVLSTSIYLMKNRQTPAFTEMKLNSETVVASSRSGSTPVIESKSDSKLHEIQIEKSSGQKTNERNFINPIKKDEVIPVIVAVSSTSNNNLNETNFNNSPMTVNSSKDNMDFLQPFSPELFEEEGTEIDLLQKEVSSRSKNNLSRWSFAVLGGISHSDSKSLLDTSVESNGQLKSIDHAFYSAMLKYDLSQRFAISAGVTQIQIEQEWSGMNVLYYPPNSIHPENYDMYTALGSITGNATLINQALFGHDTSFSFSFTGSFPDTTLESEMKIKERFQYIQIPFQVYYKIINRKVSPFLAASITAGFLTSNSIYLNDIKMPFNYNEEISRTVFSTGLSAGTDIQICRRWNAIIQIQMEKQLTPVLKSNREWKPEIFKIGGGVGFRF